MNGWETVLIMLTNSVLFGVVGYRLGRVEARAQGDRERLDSMLRRVELTDQRVDILREEIKLDMRHK